MNAVGQMQKPSYLFSLITGEIDDPKSDIMEIGVDVLIFHSSLKTRWWFQLFFIFIPIWGRFPFLTNIFQMAWNHQPEKLSKKPSRELTYPDTEGREDELVPEGRYWYKGDLLGALSRWFAELWVDYARLCPQ